MMQSSLVPKHNKVYEVPAKPQSASRASKLANVPQVRKQPTRQPQGRVDERLAEYLHAITDPWSAPLARGLTGDRMIPMTCVVKRQNAMSFNLAGSDTVGAGVELSIILNDFRDPYLVWKTPTGDAHIVGADALTPDNYSIPGNSYGRVVGAAIRIRYLGAEINRGGAFYHFPHDREGTGIDSLLHDDSWGSMPSELIRAISAVQVKPNPITFHHAPEAGFGPLVGHADAAFTGGIPSGTSAIRLLYVGPETSCNFSIEICEVVEYFHVTHRHMAGHSMPHPSGVAVQSAIACHMQAPGSGHSSPDHSGDHTSWLRKAAHVIGEAGGLIATTGKTAGQAIWAYKGLKSMLNASSAIATGAMVAL